MSSSRRIPKTQGYSGSIIKQLFSSRVERIMIKNKEFCDTSKSISREGGYSPLKFNHMADSGPAEKISFREAIARAMNPLAFAGSIRKAFAACPIVVAGRCSDSPYTISTSRRSTGSSASRAVRNVVERS
jgi:hypothetical protein